MGYNTSTDGRFTLLALKDEARSDTGTWTYQDLYIIFSGEKSIFTARAESFSERIGYQGLSLRETLGELT